MRLMMNACAAFSGPAARYLIVDLATRPNVVSGFIASH